MGSSITPEDVLLPNELSHVAQERANRRSDLWRSNYHEASIYIEEGLNNDKFENHPRKRASKLVAAPTPTVASALIPGQQQALNTTPTTTITTTEANLLAAPTSTTADQRLLSAQSHYQASPLITCAIQGEKSASSNNEFNNYNNNNTNGEHAQKWPDNKTDGAASGAFLLGGQYTTIETYILVHNRYFYQLDLAASIVLLLLALVEPPAVDGYELKPSIHAAIEMFALGIIAIELLLKFRWMGPRRFFSHGRTVSKLLVMVAMNLETIIILLRHSIHARYSRALRPIFLLDNHYCHGLRRAVRQIFQSLPPIIDMFTLAMFFMFVFSIFGFYMFASNNHYFSDMPKTVGNLLILATTANLPDIMMPSYAISRWSAVYFVLFIIIHLFLFTNLTMAAVYEIFTRREKEKFHKLLLHRRKACQKAFKLLVSRRQPNKIQYRQFMGLMRYLNQKCSMFDAYLIFKALDTDKSGSLSLEEFYQVYDFINLEWKLIYPHFKWYDDYEFIPRPCKSLLGLAERIIRHRFFEWSIDLLIVALALLQFVEASAFELPIPGLKLPLMVVTTTQNKFNTPPLVQLAPEVNETLQQNGTTLEAVDDLYVKPDKISTAVFIGIFSIEALVRCLALGCTEYWAKRWNRFDLLVLLVSIVGLISGTVGGHPFGWVLVLRVMRLMRTFEFKRRYKDMWQTLTYILLKRFVSMTCVVMVLYYFFGIVGMELLGDYDLRNCCQNTSLESQFKYDNSTEGAKYYLNDFGDIIASYLTLFSMTSNTYWLATMEAYAIVSGTNWVRLFFGMYYLSSIIVMNIVIAFILESFLFHINYRNKMGDHGDDTNLFTVSVTLSSFEVDFLRDNLTSRRDTRKLNQIVKKLRLQQGQEEAQAKGRTHLGPSDQFNDETISLLSGQTKGHTKYSSKGQRNHSTVLHVDGDKQQLASDHHLSITPNVDIQKPAIEQQQQQQAAIGNSNKRKKLLSSSSSITSVSSLGSGAGGGPLAAAAAAAVKKKPASQTQPKIHITAGSDLESDSSCHRPEWYLIYQAEQIRNKFSFTMKMYADEVGGWLAEAEQADQDEMSLMISRNQIRAEHVAMARLARRNLAEMQQQPMGALDGNGAGVGHLLDWTRPRSWSTSGGGAANRPGESHQRDQNDGSSPTKSKQNK